MLKKNEKIKLILDSVSLVCLILQPFLKIVTKFGYLDLYLFWYSLRDSTPDLGFSIYKEGPECPDIVFLNNCDFFDRLFYSSIGFGLFYIATLVFLSLNIFSYISARGASKKPAVNYNYLFPLSYFVSFGIQVMYGKLFDEDLVLVEGMFNISYQVGAFVMWASLCCCLASLGVYTCYDSMQGGHEERLLDNSKAT